MESSYQTISKLPTISAIANIISKSPSSTQSKSLQNPQGSGSTHGNNAQKTTNGLSINLSQKNLTAEQLRHLSTNFPLQSSIVTLKLGFNDFRDEGAEMISSMLRLNRSITLLDLGFTNIGDVGVEFISTALLYNQTLKVLYLSGNSITSTGFKSLGNSLQLNKTLQALYLTGNTGKAEGAKYIARGLKFNNSLHKLFLNGNKIDSDGCSSLSDTLLTNHSITSVNLSDNNIADNGLQSLSEAMANHRNLQELELSFNRITANGVTPLIDSLIGYHSLRRLLLDNNKLCDLGAKSLSYALPHMKLTELNVGFNDIRTDGLLSIIGSLSMNRNLAILCLSGNYMDEVVAKALANLLLSNTSLQSVLLDRTNLSSLAERYIATGLASNRLSFLSTLTGFELGKVLHLLGSPAVVCDMSNEQALKYLNTMWKNVERAKNGGNQVNTPIHPTHHNQPQPSMKSSSSTNSFKSLLENERKSSNNSLSQMKRTSSRSSSRENISNEQNVIVGSRRFKDLPFNSNEFSDLLNYFYSPANPQGDRHGLSSRRHSENQLAKGSTSKENVVDYKHHERPHLEGSPRPMKKQVNKFTVARINNYPTIKSLLEECKAAANDTQSLAVLRQLKYLEDNLNIDSSSLEIFFMEKVLDK